MLTNKDYIKKMTVEDFLKLCGLPDDDDALACFIESNSDSSIFTGGYCKRPETPASCRCCVYGGENVEVPLGDKDCVENCRNGIVEWLNLKCDKPIPVVPKPFVYDGEIVVSFSFDYYDGQSFVRLYGDDDCDELIDSIPFSKEEQEKMYDTVGSDSIWQWNYIVDMFGDKEPVITIIEEEDCADDDVDDEE